MLTVTETIITQLRERVLDGSYAPGQRLQENALAQDLNVSRTPIRDALRVLASEELLVYSPNRGYVVRDVGLQDALDAYDVRATLEGLACRTLVMHGMTDSLNASFDALLEQGERIVEGSQWGPAQHEAWSKLNTEFHLTIAVSARNKPLEEILRQVRRIPRMFDSRLHPNTEFFKSIYTHAQRRRSHREHVKIVEVLRAGDASRVEALMREHVYVNRDLLRMSYQDQPNLAAEAAAAPAKKPRRRPSAR
jgi:GntR family transcriptional regulator of vanillate catabolism